MADVIVCLGNVFYNPKSVESMKLRTLKSAELYRQGKAGKVIFTGGFKTRKDLSEARFMADYAEERGVPKKDMMLEEMADSTVGNALYCKKIIDKEDFESVIVVTSPYHLRRVKYVFRKLIPNKDLKFERCENNLGMFELTKHYLSEIRSLFKLKRNGIDLPKV
ncbi:MAG: YdcF family protein [archaeon]